MKIEYDRILANKKFDYEVSRDEFNKLMRIKKTAERYDRFGRKKVTIERDSKGKAFVKAGVKPPERIKSDYIKGPIAIVCFSTKPESTTSDFTCAATSLETIPTISPVRFSRIDLVHSATTASKILFSSK